jgi:ferredoxin
MNNTNADFHFAVLDIQACLGCGKCVDACKTKAIPPLIGLYSALLEIDKKKCDGCGECVSLCTQHAIKLGRRFPEK